MLNVVAVGSAAMLPASAGSGALARSRSSRMSGIAVLLHDRDVVTVGENGRVTAPSAQGPIGFARSVPDVGAAISAVSAIAAVRMVAAHMLTLRVGG